VPGAVEPCYTPAVPSVLQLLGPSSGGIRLHVAELVHRLPGHGWDATAMGPPGVMSDLLPTQLDVVVPPFWKLPAFRPAAASVARALDGVDLLHVHGL
jgi:hypothetical protein